LKKQKRMQNQRTTSGFRTKLLGWYRRHHRKLPWRINPTPYRVWVSEVMLQQTQSKTVLSYYDRFLARFPDVQSLAKASEPELLHFWSGLGYYSRARNLQRAARQIVEKHRLFPSDFDTILALPGIGRYTAGAICSIAFNQPYPAVDGNVRRVVTRLNAIHGRVPESYFWNQVADWISVKSPSDFNQAMMELGALVCVPSNPRCDECPVQLFCEAKRLGIETKIPSVRLKRPSKKLTMVILVLKRSNLILLSRSVPGSLIPGIWELPWRIVSGRESPEEAANSLCRNIHESGIRLEACAPVRHTISNHQITAFRFFGKMERGERGMRLQDNSRWVKQGEIRTLLTSSIFHKVLKQD
jgi:A/G-specific adenine glycosylase